MTETTATSQSTAERFMALLAQCDTTDEHEALRRLALDIVLEHYNVTGAITEARTLGQRLLTLISSI